MHKTLLGDMAILSIQPVMQIKLLNMLMCSLHGYVTGHRLQTGCPVMQLAIRMCNQDLHRPVRQPGGITAACKRNLHGCATHTQRGCKQI